MLTFATLASANNAFNHCLSHEATSSWRAAWLRWTAFICALCLALFLTACGGGSNTVNGPVSAIIGADGGTIVGPDGVQLVVPPGALEGNVTITVARSRAGAPALPPGVSPSVPIYEITPHGQQFNVPVQVKIPAGSAAAADMIALVANPGGAWSTLAYTLDGGFMVMKRTSLSWYTQYYGITSCIDPVEDRYRCRNAFMTAVDTEKPVQATPSSAFAYERRITPSRSGGPGVVNTFMVLSQNAEISVPLKFSAPADCEDGKLTVEGYFDPDVPGQPSTPSSRLLEQSILMYAPAPSSAEAQLGGLSVGEYTFKANINNLPNGRQYYTFFFGCTRKFNDAQMYSNAHMDPIYVQIPTQVTTQGTKPTFNLNPSSITVLEGQPATFVARADGVPAPAIRWQVAPATGSFVDVSGEAGCAATPAPASGTETIASCTIANTPLGNTGQLYRAVATNASAVDGVNSEVAVMTVNPAQTSYWKPQTSGVPDSLHAIDAFNENIAWAVGSWGWITRTTDGGETWTAQQIPNVSALYSVSAATSNAVWAVGPDTILESKNGGVTWTPLSGATGEFLYSVSAADSTTAWAVGFNGVILKTSGSGNNDFVTQVQGTSPEETLNSVSAVSSSIAWAVGAQRILKTTDGGSTWNRQIPAGIISYGRQVVAVNADTAWVTGGRGLLHTIDGGNTWTEQRLPGNVVPYTIRAVGQTIWAFTRGTAAKVYRSTSGGTTGTWITETAIPPPSNIYNGFTAYTPNVMWSVSGAVSPYNVSVSKR